MKQILQNLKTGSTKLFDVPCPQVSAGQLLIRTSRSLVSAGTERMLVDFGKANVIEKARQQPDKVRMAINKARVDGLMPTLEAVRSKLDSPLPLGYCNVGEVLEVAKGIAGFAVGDRVASNGRHAEVVSVPVNLCARIPQLVSDEEAAFTVVGAIGLQGIRLVQPTLGEVVVVTGLGLIGQITVQLLRAHGCRVLGIDFDPARLALAKGFGAEVVNLSEGEDPIAIAERFSRGRGVDAVIITAASKSSEPMHQAALMCRKRGRIVLVGVAGLSLSRDDFFKKELTFQVSCSYGPGRYDIAYEEGGQDYPIGYVRWTEQRNFEAVLDMMADGRLNVEPLISHRFPLDQTEDAYEVVGGREPALGILLEYSPPSIKPEAALRNPSINLAAVHSQKLMQENPAIAFIGAGNYASAILIPAFKEAGARLRTVASSAGVSGTHAAHKYGFDYSTTDLSALFADEEVDAVVITTRHDSHARFVLQALEAGKHVFVEKPLCLTLRELEEIEGVYDRLVQKGNAPILMVGFNRRFSPHVLKIRELLKSVSGPKALVMTVNAGPIPSDHWTQQMEIGGGRIIGEACHFIDLLRYLADSNIVSWSKGTTDCLTGDTVSVQLGFADHSIGTLHYFSNGSKTFPKERLEVYGAGRVLHLENFRRLRGFGYPTFRKMNLWRQDKGQKKCAAAFINAIRNGNSGAIPPDQIIEVSRVSIELAKGSALRGLS